MGKDKGKYKVEEGTRLERRGTRNEGLVIGD